jgi:hypothetical protein
VDVAILDPTASIVLGYFSGSSTSIGSDGKAVTRSRALAVRQATRLAAGRRGPPARWLPG